MKEEITIDEILNGLLEAKNNLNNISEDELMGKIKIPRQTVKMFVEVLLNYSERIKFLEDKIARCPRIEPGKEGQIDKLMNGLNKVKKEERVKPIKPPKKDK